MLKISELNVGLWHQTLNELKKGRDHIEQLLYKYLGTYNNWSLASKSPPSWLYIVLNIAAS